MKILSLDPSSTACGWALLDGTSSAVLDLGVIRPGDRHPYWSRVTRICDAVGKLISRLEPDEVIVEVTSGKIYKARRASSLAALGMAQGAVWRTVQVHGHHPHVINEQQWTGRRPKRDRARELGIWCEEYRAVQGSDRGGDIADAVGLGIWWLIRWRADRLAGRG